MISRVLRLAFQRHEKPQYFEAPGNRARCFWSRTRAARRPNKRTPSDEKAVATSGAQVVADVRMKSHYPLSQRHHYRDATIGECRAAINVHCTGRRAQNVRGSGVLLRDTGHNKGTADCWAE